MADRPAQREATSLSRFSKRGGALRHPAYRRFWLGSLAAIGGAQLQILGQGWLVFDLTRNPMDLGLLGAATALPTILMTLFGGVLADRIDKRRLIALTSLAVACLLLLLALLDLKQAVRVWHIYAIAAATGLISGLNWPARAAVFPLLIERGQMASAVALNSVVWQVTGVVAPGVGGALMALFGTAVVFFTASAGFFAMAVVMLTLEVRKVEGSRAPTFQQFKEGVRFILGARVFFILIPLTYASMFFGVSYIQLMPAFADALGVDEAGFGFLLSAVSAGAIVGTMFSGMMQNARRLGWVMLGCVCMYGLIVMSFSASRVYPLSISLAFLGGTASTVFLITSMTVLQLRVPDGLRGRVMGIHGITFSLVPLGGLLSGTVARGIGVRSAVAISAGVLVLIVIAVAATQREVRTLGRGAER